MCERGEELAGDHLGGSSEKKGRNCMKRKYDGPCLTSPEGEERVLMIDVDGCGKVGRKESAEARP